jgi:2,4-dienoyl-CoA reductase (NADPH2)
LRYYRTRIDRLGIDLKLNTQVDADQLRAAGFDEVIVATGIEPRTPDLPGINHPKVVSYIDVIQGRKPVGNKVAIMGTGGIGFDVAELITHSGTSASLDIGVFAKEWGSRLPPVARSSATTSSRSGWPAVARKTWSRRQD